LPLYFYYCIFLTPILTAARSKTLTVFGRSNPGIVGLNPTQGMDVCPRFSVFVLSCVEVETLRRAYLPSKESYQVSNRSQVKNPRQRKV